MSDKKEQPKITLEEAKESGLFEEIVTTAICNTRTEKALRKSLEEINGLMACLPVLGDNDLARARGGEHLQLLPCYNGATNVANAIGDALIAQAANHKGMNKVCLDMCEQEVLDAAIIEVETREGGR